MIPLLYPPYLDIRRDQALDPDAVKNSVQDINPKAIMEWVALTGAIAAAGMWLTRKVIKPVWANIWGILKIGNSMEKLGDCVAQLSASVALSEARTRLMINNRQDVGVWESDAEGNCTFANTKMLQALGGGFELVAGKNWIQVIADEDRDRVHREWVRAIETGTDFNLEYHWKRPDTGQHIPIRVEGRRIAVGSKALGWQCEVTFIF